jgi:hypothetical protein
MPAALEIASPRGRFLLFGIFLMPLRSACTQLQH